MHIPAPKMKLPGAVFVILLLFSVGLFFRCLSQSLFISGHEESYNPPPEYLPTEEEVVIIIYS